jgi:2-iminobutanoate/2-iminopropanoate deaminase
MIRRLLPRPALVVLAIAVSAVPAAAQSPEPPMVVERLYFGRNVTRHWTLSEHDWRSFVDRVAVPRLPGLTTWAGRGTWRDPAGKVVNEETFVMEVMHAEGDGVSAQLDTIAWEYMERFGQQSVMRTTERVRGREYRRGDRTPTPGAAERVDFLTPPGDWPYPFSPAVRVGGLIFVSGQVGSRMENGRLVIVPGGIEAETRQALDNVREIVERAGSSMGRVVKCTVMMADMAEWPRMNAIYATYFPGPKPARSALGANGLALGARVEVECIAAAGE